MPQNCSRWTMRCCLPSRLRMRSTKDAPKVWQEAASNVSFQLERGDRRAVDQAFARAAHVTKLSLHYPRVTANTIEPRSVMAYREAGQRFTLRSTTQTPYRLREIAADVLGMPELDLRVVSPDVGGGFGMKSQVYPEEILVLWAARKLDRPVKMGHASAATPLRRTPTAGIRSSKPSSRWMPTRGSWQSVPPLRSILAPTSARRPAARRTTPPTASAAPMSCR